MTTISSNMIDHYLGALTLGWYDDHDNPPTDVNNYYPLIKSLILELKKFNDTEYFKLGLQYLLKTYSPADPIWEEDYGSRICALDPEEIHEIANYIYKTIWPDEPLPAIAPDVDIINMPLQQWWEQRDALNPHMPPVGGPEWQKDPAMNAPKWRRLLYRWTGIQ